MSNNKGNQSISEKISDLLKPKSLVEEETENSEARVESFAENEQPNVQLSDIRKQTAKNLSELDDKYKGKAVSRKDLELDGDDDEESSEEEDSEQDESENASDSEEDDEMASEDENDEDDSDYSGSDDDGGYDFDLSQFTKKKSGAASTSEQETTEILKKVSLNEEIQKGISVQNQQKLWEKLLEVRIKSQKMLITANGFPDADAHLELSTLDDPTFSEKVEKTCDGLHRLMDNLLELQSTLVERFPDSKDVLKRKKEDNGGGGFLKKSKLAEYSDLIEDNHESYSSFRNEVLQKWHDRTKSVKDAKNPIANLNIMTKIENALLAKSEMIRKTQIYRGDYEIYGVEKPAEESADEIQIPEIFDDSEFYHQLLRELIEYKSNTDENQSEITQKFIELQKVRQKMKKKVDTRASKGRKIRYVVYNKLVNFMPPKDNCEWTEEAKNELFSSLFGAANQH